MAPDIAPVVKPLITPGQWVLVALALAAFTTMAWLLGATIPGDTALWTTSTFHVDLSGLQQYLHYSKWIALAMGLAFVLTVLDRALSQGQHRTSH